ncbi:DNA translocase FtsK [Bacillus sp. FSL W7-1360]
MAKRKKRKKNEWKSQLTFELIGLAMLVVSIVTLARLGSVGEAFVRLFRFFLGEWFVFLAFSFFLLAVYMMFKRKKPRLWSRRMAGVYIIVLSGAMMTHAGLFHVLQANDELSDASVVRTTWALFWNEMTQPTSNDLGGGMIGAVGYAASHFLFANAGTYLLCFILLMSGAILISGYSLSALFGKLYRRSYLFITDMCKSIWTDIRTWHEQSREKMAEERTARQKRKKKRTVTSIASENEALIKEPEGEPEIVDFTEYPAVKVDTEVHDRKKAVLGAHQPEELTREATFFTQPLQEMQEENEAYVLPSFDLLATLDNPDQKREKQQLTANAHKLEKTLESFGVNARVSKVHLGPAVTKYEVNPSVGVKVSKIVNLADDLALALAAKDIRIEAPIPGKPAIGIEVPNQEVALVSLKEVLRASSKRQHEVLAVGLGRDISGEPVLAALNEMPHLLVAGATGSGKSVCMNVIITSILMKAKPHEVKLVMIDPKMVELNVYNGVPHLLAPVVTDPKRASQALKKVVAEMERRYDLFSHTGTRNMEGYNEYVRLSQRKEGELVKHAPLPYIVVIVDELADLMMVASSDVEDAIARLAQMARAAGIHMVIATQRPSVDVITGVIKANIPSRIAFGVSSQTDARTILDTGGAEKLLGRGDMLYLPMGATKPTRVQGAFLSDDEVERVVAHVISQQKAQYAEEMTSPLTTSVENKKTDDLFEQAVELVTDSGRASVSMLQRRFRIGYSRAARLIDELEEKGIIGPYEGSKPRQVYVKRKIDEEETS